MELGAAEVELGDADVAGEVADTVAGAADWAEGSGLHPVTMSPSVATAAPAASVGTSQRGSIYAHTSAFLSLIDSTFSTP